MTARQDRGQRLTILAVDDESGVLAAANLSAGALVGAAQALERRQLSMKAATVLAVLRALEPAVASAVQ